jgi:hypothetical protein
LSASNSSADKGKYVQLTEEEIESLEAEANSTIDLKGSSRLIALIRFTLSTAIIWIIHFRRHFDYAHSKGDPHAFGDPQSTI